MLLQNLLDATKSNQAETVVFAKDNRATFAAHLEHRLAAVSDRMYVRRTMIVDINDGRSPAKRKIVGISSITQSLRFYT